MSDEKVTIKLKKQLLPSEIEEIKAQRRKRVLKFFIGFLLALLCFGLGYIFSGVTKSIYYTAAHSKFDKIATVLSEDWLYKDEYENIEEVLEDQAYKGMTTFNFDPYTTYFTEEELEDFSKSINQTLPGGVGASYLANGDVAVILKVYPNTPAYYAGIEAGDIIYKVDGVLVDEEMLSDLASHVGGMRGTKVKVTVLRDNKEIEFECVRESLDTSFYGIRYDDYLYLEINSFGDGTYNSVYNFLKANSDIKKVVIDLRDNGGGYQDAVSKICGLFIGPSKVYMNEYYADDEKIEDLTPKNSEQFIFDKIAILTNSNTASAAEVMAVCLKEQLDNVSLVGETTFGKGVAQHSYIIEDGSAIKYTVSKWTSPKDSEIHGIGVSPDVKVRNHEATYLGYLIFEEGKEIKYDSVSTYTVYSSYRLDYLGYEVDRFDGYYSKTIEKAVLDFQKDHGLNENGVIDLLTYRTLYCAFAKANGMDIDKDIQLNKAIEMIKG